jgi:L-ascorbate metabolism protein UlaG (beta-lactamase superfamily)
MNIGFESIGNATIICHDGTPVLATDPWIVGGAYFGSWMLSHEIPPAQFEAIRRVMYVWISHGHPDHLSGDSVALLKDKKILVPDHVGARIFEDLKSQGFDVHVMPDRKWVQLSEHIRVMCLPDYNQDAAMLIDVNGRLVVNLNDSGDRGQGRTIKDIVRKYPTSFLLALSGYGDADMINYFREDGSRIPPPAAQKTPPGRTIARVAESYGVKFFVPSSSMHRYSRKDSAWADEYTTRLEDYPKGFDSKIVELLPAFIRFDCETDALERIDPRENERVFHDPSAFGDDWDERLEGEEKETLREYFRSFERLHRSLDFIRFKVGGEITEITFNKNAYRRGLTFEAPRHSLVASLNWEIFDDLLIGNFMRTTLHGEWGPGKLYPDFTPYVAKYGDNGRAKTDAQLTAYFETYRKRDPLGHLRHSFDTHCVRPAHEAVSTFLRRTAGPNSRAFTLAKSAYWGLRRAL